MDELIKKTLATKYLFSASTVAVALVSFTVGVCFQKIKKNVSFFIYWYKKRDQIVSEKNLKMVLVVRTDLEMGKGKVAAQCCHASLQNFQKLLKIDPKLLKDWLKYSGEKKIILRAPSENFLDELKRSANQLGICASIIRDAGHTQVMAGSKTVIAIGPNCSQRIDAITRHLKLY